MHTLLALLTVACRGGKRGNGGKLAWLAFLIDKLQAGIAGCGRSVGPWPACAFNYLALNSLAMLRVCSGPVIARP